MLNGIIVGNDPVNFVDPLGLRSWATYGPDGGITGEVGITRDPAIDPGLIAGVAGAGAKLLAKGGKAVCKTASKKINNSVLGKPRIGSANKLDPYHSFNDIVDNYAGDAAKFDIPTTANKIKIVPLIKMKNILLLSVFQDFNAMLVGFI